MGPDCRICQDLEQKSGFGLTAGRAGHLGLTPLAVPSRPVRTTRVPGESCGRTQGDPSRRLLIYSESDR